MQITLGRGENVYAMNIRDAGLLLGEQLPTEDVMMRIVRQHEGPINQVMSANNLYGFKPRKSAKRSTRTKRSVKKRKYRMATMAAEDIKTLLVSLSKDLTLMQNNNNFDSIQRNLIEIRDQIENMVHTEVGRKGLVITLKKGSIIESIDEAIKVTRVINTPDAPNNIRLLYIDGLRRLIDGIKEHIEEIMWTFENYAFRPTSAKKRSSKKKTSAKKRAQLK